MKVGHMYNETCHYIACSVSTECHFHFLIPMMPGLNLAHSRSLRPLCQMDWISDKDNKETSRQLGAKMWMFLRSVYCIQLAKHTAVLACASIKSLLDVSVMHQVIS